MEVNKMDPMEDTYQFIKSKIPFPALLENLAEELGEMQHHILKAARAYREDNPTPAKVEEEMEKAYEEYGDVMNLARIINLRFYPLEMQEKLDRWVQRIIEKEEKMENEDS